ncbi:hypothetical protein CDO52_07575 [Nocardiopsis gilva YIM 90087]|uniref:Uncharacterized protein n=1 Tax=Nocardiopsis gilva YIM 90087 TaxID=1235441 RepID=A0A223S3G9_9ACTN|nr:hypothetical protein [Nocardiopsis gilva]ASU82665.1 hypothetical protein CDO52_07575 [Nocardiopsis gilva YIM 90087]
MADPITLAVAAAVAGKVTEALDDGARAVLKKLRAALRERFGNDPEARRALEAARDDDGEDAILVEELATHMDGAQQSDADIRALVEALRPHFDSGGGNVTNTITGDVEGIAIQARDVHGVNLNRP